MGILGQKKAAPQSIRVEKVIVPPKPKPSRPTTGLAPPPAATRYKGTSSASRKSGPSSVASSSRPSPNPRLQRTQSASPYPSSSDETRKRKAIRSTPRDSPAFDNDSDSDGDEGHFDFNDFSRKRARRSDSRPIDAERKLKHRKAFDNNEPREPRMIHAVDISSVKKENCIPFPGAKPDQVAVKLQYPSQCRSERYELVIAKDQLDPVKEIIEVVKHVAQAYLTKDQVKPFNNPNGSFLRQLERASSDNYRDIENFKSALIDYNREIRKLVANGSIAANLDEIHHIPSELVSFILSQVYDRTVSPKAEILNKYEMGSDNVYGELLHPFVTKVLVEQTGMVSSQVFVDLGSGVGNVVLQAALEIGCRSYGCEMMENACNLAEDQEREFRSRCLLWGLQPGRVHLERGDFRKNEKILQVLKEADVVLVNNKAFTSILNDALVNMFLDLKQGCKIISLKSFVHENSAASNSVANNILDVQQYRYHQNWVSWAASDGDYYISTKR